MKGALKCILTVFLLHICAGWQIKTLMRTTRGRNMSGKSKKLQQSSSAEIGELETTDSLPTTIRFGKTVSVFNPAELNISHANPFGEEVRSVSDAASELKHLVTARRQELPKSDFLKCRIEYLVNVLKKHYVPSLTVEFMNLAMSGEWSHQYSNVLLRRADASLNYRIIQSIIPEDSKIGNEEGMSGIRLMEINNKAEGKVVNRVRWNVIDNQDKLNAGELSVHANYTINSRGSLNLKLQEHVMTVDKLSLDATEVVMAIQRSIPFQFFDPTNSMCLNVYIDPELRITETTGSIFSGVYDIFVREKVGEVEMTDDDGLSAPVSASGLGFGRPKLRKSGNI